MIDCIYCNATKEVCKASDCILIYQFSSLDLHQPKPFMLNGIPPLINWTSQLAFLGLLGGIYHFYSNVRNFWLCTVYPCPTKRTLGVYGLIHIGTYVIIVIRFSVFSRKIINQHI